DPVADKTQPHFTCSCNTSDGSQQQLEVLRRIHSSDSQDHRDIFALGEPRMLDGLPRQLPQALVYNGIVDYAGFVLQSWRSGDQILPDTLRGGNNGIRPSIEEPDPRRTHF